MATLDPAARAQAFNAQGLALYDRKEYDLAIKAFDRAIELAPGFAKAWNNRGLCYRMKGEYHRSIEDFTRAIELEPDAFEAWVNRGVAYEHIDFRVALEDLARAFERNPREPEIPNSMGACWIGLGDKERAQVEFDRASALDPNFAKPYLNRGIYFHERGEHERALREIERGLACPIPDHGVRAELLYTRGLVHMALDRFERARADFDAALEIAPRDARFYNDRGLARHELGDRAGALADFATGLDLAPEDADLHANRGVVEIAIGEHDAAIADLGHAIELEPKNPRHYTNRGAAFFEKGEIERAIEDFDRALALDPGYSDAAENRATALAKLGATPAP